MTTDKPDAVIVNTSAHPADRAAIAAILADADDNPMCNKAVRVAHEALRQVPGAAFDGEPFMLTGLARIGDEEYIACTCFYHTVLIVEDWAFVYTTEEGGMVPWIDKPRIYMPRMEYFDCRVAIDPSVRATLLPYVRELMEKYQVPSPDSPAQVDDNGAPSAPSM